MFFTLFGWRKASKCKNLIKQVQRRINLLQTKRHAIVRQLREDVALLIKAGHENIAFNRAEILFKDENIVAIYELLDGFCEFIITNLSYIRWNKDCPNDINEAVSTLIFASARCGDIPELRGVRKVFGQRYGQRFEKTALELLPGNLVNFQVKERLSILSVPDDVKRSLVDEIAIDYCLRPGILAIEYASELQQRKEEEQRENQVQDKDVQNNFSKIEESKREVLDGNGLEGKAIFVDSRSTSHTSSDSINSSIAQQSSLDTLESPTCNKAEKEDNFAGPRSPWKSKSVSLSTEESQVASSDYPTTSKHKEERKMAATSSESLPQFPEDTIVYLDDVEEVQSITEEGSCQDQRIFKFKSSRFLPKTEEVEDDVKHMEQYESGSEKSSSSSSRNRRNSNAKRPRRRSISQDHSSSEDIQCMIYYNKPWKRYTADRRNRSQLSSKHQKKTAIGKSEETRDAEKRQNQTRYSNHCCLNHPCYSCTNDGRVSHEVPPWTQKRFLTVVHHCHCPTIGESDAEMERHAFPHHPRRKSCEFGASPCDVLTSPDRQRKRNSTSGDVSSANPSSKPTSSLTRKEPKAPFLRAMTMPQERSKHSNRENVERCTSFPTESPIHVHPKLPDCDDIAAKFSALKKEHSKNRHA
ncbi:IST1P [Salix koriyanagi]|uniref:IST1P n=1 Tax=Salix koriyanagi TaxID=2511006 RepID=A0A9Q1A4Z6_9ROSI|nr:IST1P [Salix koriyanagi]